MLITTLTIDTRKDIQPFITLGVELKKADAGVRLVTFKNFGDFVGVMRR